MNKTKPVPIEFIGTITTEIAAEIDLFLTACEKGGPWSTVLKGVAKGYAWQARTERSETAVHLAVIKSNAKILNLLIEAGADLDEADTNDTTPLMCAIRALNKDGVQTLIEAGAKIDKLDDEGWSALMHACLMSFEPGVALLVSAGARLDVVEERGWSALHYAASDSDEGAGCVQVLLTAGAQLDMKGAHEETPLDVARRAGCKEITLMLEAEASRREAVELKRSLGPEPNLDSVKSPRL